MMLFLRWILALLSRPLRATKPNATLKPQKSKTAAVHITYKDWAMGRDAEYPPSPEIIDSAVDLLTRVNKLIIDIKLPYYGITSGYRPGKYNVAAGGAPSSAHRIGKAVDLRDRGDQQIAKFLAKNEHYLVKYDLYMEHPDYTKGWCHLQTRPTKRRVFIP